MILVFLCLYCLQFSSVQSLSHVRLFVTPWFAACQASLFIIPEYTQTHVLRVSDAIQPSHPLSSPTPPTFNLSQHQGLFHWVGSLHQVAKVLEFQLQHQSFQWIFRTDFLWDGSVESPCSPRDSQESSPTSQFKSILVGVLKYLSNRIAHKGLFILKFQLKQILSPSRVVISIFLEWDLSPDTVLISWFGLQF